MISVAYAMGAGGAGGAQGGFASFVPLIIMFAIFYFLLIRPQQKKAKEQTAMLSNLKKGNRVVTSGGIHGTITSLDENSVTLEIAEKTRVKFVRGNVSALLDAKADKAVEKKEKK